MRIIELLRRTPDAETERLARISVDVQGGPADIEVLIPEFREGLELLGVGGALADGDGRLSRPEDGEAYLDAVLLHYRGSRLFAREVHDER